eukprot:TRINITY_DN6257_c0_g1_i1.p1 TRINITY_DN6257_c0_g1~~TRINITY_DN6257_c0_g1_i1.p1  ORF type:complete len:185 (-),score=53.04 TRINITY_DN6257_c0_g1_i1:231-785(-)
MERFYLGDATEAPSPADARSRIPASHQLWPRAKVVLAGDSGVGKSAVLRAFCGLPFCGPFAPTLGIDFKLLFLCTADTNSGLCLQVFDTAGQLRYRTISTSFFRNADAVIILYDTTDAASFSNVQQWLELVQQHASSENVLVAVAGNKIDMPNKCAVTTATATAFVQQSNISIFEEVSAKTGVM